MNGTRRLFSRASAAVAALISTALCSQVVAAAPHAAGFEVSVGGPVAPRVFDGDVRTLPPIAAKPARDRRRDRPAVIKPAGPGPLIAADAVVLPNMPVPSQHFLGLTSHGDCGGTVCGGGVPPDPVGDVGPNHYIQAVNTGVGIFSKTGTRLAAFTFDGLWAGANTGTACDANNVGDPTVVYDPISDRWFVADFAFTSSSSPPFYECIAVSKTGDPVSGGWYLYAVRADDAAHPYFPDYPKMGIWPDGLYMTANEFEGNTYREVRIWAFNRQAMVAGQPLQSVIVDTNSASTYTMLPSNLRGSLPPPGTPNYVVMEDPSIYAYDVYKFHVDWVTPSNSTFTGPTKVTQGSYGPPNSPSTYDIIPQADTNTDLDSLGDGLMMQAQYRNIAGTESLWVAHTVRPSGTTSGPTGIQWAQIDVTGGTIATTPVQEQIFTNGSDGLYRWIPSIAVDGAGNAAVGYSASNATSFPSIRYAGRLATDSLNSLAQGEAILFSGTGSQKFNCGGPCSRWGDYSALTVDPVDDCTFWYVNEYYVTTGSTDWQTRIGSFKFPSCNAPTPGPTDTSTPTPTATNTATRTPTSTNTPTAPPTNTPTATATATPSPTRTPTSTNTPTTPPTTTPTATATATPSPTRTPTNTPTATATATNSPTVTPTHTGTPTRTPTATSSPTWTPTATHTPTATPTATTSPTVTPTASNTPTHTATATATTTSSPTATPTATDTPTLTPTVTSTPTHSPTLTPTGTETPTQTPTVTNTPTVTPTPGPACTLCGDANGDGAIDIVDALFVSQLTVQLRMTLACPGAADVNGNASVDIVDALFISQYTVGLRTELNCVISGL